MANAGFDAWHPIPIKIRLQELFGQFVLYTLDNLSYNRFQRQALDTDMNATANFPIERGIPVPPRHATTNPCGHTRYPFRKMQVGDSFVMDKPQPTASGRAVEAAARIGGGVKFTCRKIDANTSRIWRIA